MDNCILWDKYRDKDGYGVKHIKRRPYPAHRVAYCEDRGIPLASITGMVVRHRCDNPPCINPRHLVLGTHRENIKDRDERDRQAKGEKNGFSILTSEKVKEIREIYMKSSREFGCRALSEKYGVSKTTIWMIVNRKNWKHLP